MKDQRTHFNAFSRLFINRSRVHECRMRHTSGAAIQLGVEAFDQHDLLGRLSVKIEPPMLRIRFHRICFALSIRVDQSNADQVRVRHRMGISDRERVLENLLDRAPDIDDLVSSRQQFFGLIGKMMGNSRLRCTVGLVDVDTSDGATEQGCSRRMVGLGAANGVVEDENARCASPVQVSMLPNAEADQPTRLSEAAPFRDSRQL